MLWVMKTILYIKTTKGAPHILKDIKPAKKKFGIKTPLHPPLYQGLFYGVKRLFKKVFKNLDKNIIFEKNKNFLSNYI